jgi:hypothetical protein
MLKATAVGVVFPKGNVFEDIIARKNRSGNWKLRNPWKKTLKNPGKSLDKTFKKKYNRNMMNVQKMNRRIFSG